MDIYLIQNAIPLIFLAIQILKGVLKEIINMLMLSRGVLAHINKCELIILRSSGLIEVLDLLVDAHNWRHLTLDLMGIHRFLKHKAILLWHRHAEWV